MGSHEAHEGLTARRSVGGGRYALKSLLGHGGMAAVYLSHDTVLDRPVAVKILHSDLVREPSFRERFRREAQAVARLNHTNIVSVFDSGEDVLNGALEPYIVMEYIEGRSLATVLEEDSGPFGAMPTSSALNIAADVLSALAASHEMGLVHRDIKPANVMITKRGIIKVMDFGIARAVQSGGSSMTQTGMVVGTPQYLSPEQALGRGVDQRSDVYSVGCMLFELLTGRLPFVADSPLAMAYQHVQEVPPSVSAFNRSLPPAIDVLVAKALEKVPEDRFPTAHAMRTAIEDLKTHLVSGAPPFSAAHGAGHTVKWAAAPAVPLFTPGLLGGSVNVVPPQPQRTSPAPDGLQTAALGRAGGGLRRRRKKGVLAGSAAAVFCIIGFFGIALVGQERGRASGSNPHEVSSVPPVDTSASPKGGVVSPTQTGFGIVRGDKSLKMPVSECTSPLVWPDGDVSVPWFKLHHIESVRQCAEAGGWKLTEKKENETLWGQGIVVNQDPLGAQVDPERKNVTVWISTGHS
ncbi:protein kinase domain-containing protein [Streptomyces chryseus]